MQETDQSEIKTSIVPGYAWPSLAPIAPQVTAPPRVLPRVQRDLQAEITFLLVSKGESLANWDIAQELGATSKAVSNALTLLKLKGSVVRTFAHGVYLYAAREVVQTAGRELAQRIIHCVTVSPGVTFTELKEMITEGAVSKTARRLEAYGKLEIRKEPCQCCGTVVYRCYLKGEK